MRTHSMRENFSLNHAVKNIAGLLLSAETQKLQTSSFLHQDPVLLLLYADEITPEQALESTRQLRYGARPCKQATSIFDEKKF